ncbi:hypothetical protein [Rhizobium sp. Root1220]|uniref:hypothetical protein n=1 Tax=Rhizobium sp. Root1220 TaxID=1736432 RepID=UPI000700B01F|nr:hypothetical protein [Rhizobium sp. Root1220]KQV64610.1 hypothetical protein ASC90_17205 [Rhizobium sp. Root1220]
MPGFRKLIVLSAFNRDDDGALIPAFEPRCMKGEETAVYVAQTLVNDYAGVVVWCREGNVTIGEQGPSVILFQSGQVPEFD